MGIVRWMPVQVEVRVRKERWLRRGRRVALAALAGSAFRLVPALSALWAVSAASPARAQTLGGGTSTAQDPVVTFSTAGQKTVTLTACNSLGCSTSTQTVTVLDPVPAISSITAAPSSAVFGSAVALSAVVTGQPPLTYSWQVMLGTTPVLTLGGSGPSWATQGYAAGSYSVQLTVTNTSGSATASVPVVLHPAAVHFYTVTPCRLLDTRTTQSPLVAGAAPRIVQVAGGCGVPPTATAVAVNVTAVTGTAAGFVAIYPADMQNQSSLVNFAAGQVRAVGSVATLSLDGLGELAATVSAGQVQLLIDIDGYFAP